MALSELEQYTYQRPWVYPKQEAAIFNAKDAAGDPARYSLVEASTKTGKTVGCIMWLFEKAYLGKRGQNFWWIAPVYGQAEIAYRRMKQSLPLTLYASNESKMTVTLPNGAVIWFKSADKPDSLYGEDVFAAVIDEASRCKEEAWHAVRSTLTATRGPIRIIGNVKGRKNWFYQLCRKAEGGERGMSYHKLIAADAVAAKVLDKEEVEDAQRILPTAVFNELYLAQPSDDEGNPFGYKSIRHCLAPLSDRKPACWGWDLAKHVDWTVGIALDSQGYVCRFVRFQLGWDATMKRIIDLTGTTPALVDSTGVGDPIVELLQKTPGSRFTGYQFTSPSKQKLMEGLVVAIQQSDIHYPEGVIQQELENFEYEYTRTGVRYSAPEGFHDDTVCSLALAQMHRIHAKVPMNISTDVLARAAALGRRR